MTGNFKKGKGQENILINYGLIDTIIEKAKVKHTDTILEINSGTGTLTMKLLEKSKRVIAYEEDKQLNKELKSKINSKPELKSKLSLMVENPLKAEFPHFDICISNIPYNLSSSIIIKLLNYNFKSAYILCQREFANKLMATPGSKDYSRLSVYSQILCKVQLVKTVSKKSFHPQLKVDSCFIKIELKSPRVKIDLSEFEKLLNFCFNRKNKNLSSNLKTPQFLKILENSKDFSKLESSNFITKVLTDLNFLESRPSKMFVEDFLKLLLEFKKHDVYF